VDLRSLDSRLTMTLRQRDDGWKLVHEHTSSPIDFETTKAVFNRQ